LGNGRRESGDEGKLTRRRTEAEKAQFDGTAHGGLGEHAARSRTRAETGREQMGKRKGARVRARLKSRGAGGGQTSGECGSGLRRFRFSGIEKGAVGERKEMALTRWPHLSAGEKERDKWDGQLGLGPRKKGRARAN